MIKTSFLLEQKEDLNKSFSPLSVNSLSSKRLDNENRLRMHKEIAYKVFDMDAFDLSEGMITIKKPNSIISLQYIEGNIDVVLPEASKLFDWVLLLYDQDNLIYNVSIFNKSKIKIHGNGKRIMGLDEPMICDMAFMSLRLTYVNDIDGWIVT